MIFSCYIRGRVKIGVVLFWGLYGIAVMAHVGVWVLLGCLAFQFYYMFASTFLRLLRALKSRMNEKSSIYGIVSHPKI